MLHKQLHIIHASQMELVLNHLTNTLILHALWDIIWQKQKELFCPEQPPLMWVLVTEVCK